MKLHWLKTYPSCRFSFHPSYDWGFSSRLNKPWLCSPRESAPRERKGSAAPCPARRPADPSIFSQKSKAKHKFFRCAWLVFDLYGEVAFES